MGIFLLIVMDQMFVHCLHTHTGTNSGVETVIPNVIVFEGGPWGDN